MTALVEVVESAYHHRDWTSSTAVPAALRQPKNPTRLSHDLDQSQGAAHLYAPALGRFLSTDPVFGGNPNTYTYPVDPINGFDLDGRFDWGGFLGNVATVAAVVALGACIVASAGVCGIVGAAAFVASTAYRGYRAVHEHKGAGWFARGVAVDFALGRFRAARGVMKPLLKVTGRLRAPATRNVFRRLWGRSRSFGLSESLYNPRLRRGYLRRASGQFGAYGMGWLNG